MYNKNNQCYEIDKFGFKNPNFLTNQDFFFLIKENETFTDIELALRKIKCIYNIRMVSLTWDE